MSYKYSYLIFAPPYQGYSAGIRYMYELARDIIRKGYSASVVNDIDIKNCIQPPIGDFDNPVEVLTFSSALLLIRFGKVVVIYPEVVSGNPLGATRVVRIVANKPGYLGGNKVFPSNERVFLYSHYYTAHVSNNIFGYLYKPMIDLEMWSEQNHTIRDLKLYYVGKGTFREGFTGADYIEVTRATPARRELPALFNRASHIVIFDNSTALAQEAALCGCTPIIIPDGSQTQDDLRKFELGDDGVAWGFSDIERAKNTAPFLREKIITLDSKYQEALESFLEQTQMNWPDHSEAYDDSLLLAFESACYERDQLRRFKNEVLSYEVSLCIELFDEAPIPQIPQGSKVVVWGAGRGAQNALKYLLRRFDVEKVVGKECKPPLWLEDYGLAYQDSYNFLRCLPDETTTILIASQFRKKIHKEIISASDLQNIKIFYVAPYLLV